MYEPFYGADMDAGGGGGEGGGPPAASGFSKEKTFFKTLQTLFLIFVILVAAGAMLAAIISLIKPELAQVSLISTVFGLILLIIFTGLFLRKSRKYAKNIFGRH